jgi:hypothetical protein
MKTTEELLNALKQTDIETFWKEHQEDLVQMKPHTFLANLIDRSGLKKATIIRNSDFDTVYFHQVVAGTKVPSRDKLLRILIALEAPFTDCQLALRLFGHAILYPRVRRDGCLIYGINNHFTLPRIQEELQKNGEEPLK